MTRQLTPFYVTKYALSAGRIETKWLELGHGTDSIYLFEPDVWSSFVKGRDAFECFEDAQKAALAQRDKKIKSLRAQIVKLEKLTFDEARS